MAQQSRREGGNGRGVRRGRAFWRDAVSRWKRSGQTRADFCAAEGLTPNTFTWWKWKLSTAKEPKDRKVRGSGPRRQIDAERAASSRSSRIRSSGRRSSRQARPRAAAPANFLPVRVLTAHRGAGADCHISSEARTHPILEVVLAGGRRIMVAGDFDPSVLTKLVATLEATPCY